MCRRELHAEFWWGNLKERGHLASIVSDGRIILKLLPNEQARMGCITIILIGIGINGELL